jgi:hypothetical protein
MGSIMGSQKIMGSDYGSNISDTYTLLWSLLVQQDKGGMYKAVAGAETGDNDRYSATKAWPRLCLAF